MQALDAKRAAFRAEYAAYEHGKIKLTQIEQNAAQYRATLAAKKEMCIKSGYKHVRDLHVSRMAGIVRMENIIARVKASITETQKRLRDDHAPVNILKVYPNDH